MGFFTMGYLIGRNSGYTSGYSDAERKYSPEINGGKVYRSMQAGENIYTGSMVGHATYPKDGIRSVDEPSGVILRPTAQELNQMNEDEATKAAKAEVAKAFENEEPIDL